MVAKQQTCEVRSGSQIRPDIDRLRIQTLMADRTRIRIQPLKPNRIRIFSRPDPDPDTFVLKMSHLFYDDF